MVVLSLLMTQEKEVSHFIALNEQIIIIVPAEGLLALRTDGALSLTGSQTHERLQSHKYTEYHQQRQEAAQHRPIKAEQHSIVHTDGS